MVFFNFLYSVDTLGRNAEINFLNCRGQSVDAEIVIQPEVPSPCPGKVATLQKSRSGRTTSSDSSKTNYLEMSVIKRSHTVDDEHTRVVYTPSISFGKAIPFRQTEGRGR